MDAASPHLALANLRVTRAGRMVVDGADLRIESPGLVVINGARGAGRSTLLHAIAGTFAGDELNRVEGRMLVHGRTIVPADVRLVTPRFRDPLRTVQQCLTTALGSEARRREPVEEALTAWGVPELIPHLDTELALVPTPERRLVLLLEALWSPAPLVLLDDLADRMDREQSERLARMTLQGAAKRVILATDTDDGPFAQRATTRATLAEGRIVEIRDARPSADPMARPARGAARPRKSAAAPDASEAHPSTATAEPGTASPTAAKAGGTHTPTPEPVAARRVPSSPALTPSLAETLASAKPGASPPSTAQSSRAQAAAGTLTAADAAEAPHAAAEHVVTTLRKGTPPIDRQNVQRAPIPTESAPFASVPDTNPVVAHLAADATSDHADEEQGLEPDGPRMPWMALSSMPTPAAAAAEPQWERARTDQYPTVGSREDEPAPRRIPAPSRMPVRPRAASPPAAHGSVTPDLIMAWVQPGRLGIVLPPPDARTTRIDAVDRLVEAGATLVLCVRDTPPPALDFLRHGVRAIHVPSALLHAASVLELEASARNAAAETRAGGRVIVHSERGTAAATALAAAALMVSDGLPARDALGRCARAAADPPGTDRFLPLLTALDDQLRRRAQSRVR